MNWLRLTEFELDSGRWLFEAGRAAAGELPYRDFSWQHPPLGLAVFAGLFHRFGSTFLVAQVGLDFLSAVVVALFLAFSRKLFRDPIACVLTVLFAFVGGTGMTLFTLNLYTPAILTGFIGTLLMLLASSGFLQTYTFRALDYIMFCLGSFICLLSKPEFIIGSLAGWMALAAADRMVFPERPGRAWLTRQAALLFFISAPAAAVYLWVGEKTGWENLWQGITGYGGAARSCPWWPTGFGFFCFLGALGEGVLLLGILAFLGWEPWISYRRLLKRIAIPAAAAALFYTWLIRGDILIHREQPWWYHPLYYAISANTVLLPFVSLGLLAFLAAIALLWGDRYKGIAWDSRRATMFVLLVTAVALSVRTLFGDLEGPVPVVSAASLPAWLIWGVAFLCSFPSPKNARGTNAPLRLIICALLAFAAVLPLEYFSVEEKGSYPTLRTRAGTVRLRELEPEASIYRFLTREEQPGETLVELPLSGGFYFAARLRSPLFATQHSELPIPFHYLKEDLKRLENHPPKLAVVSSAAGFGTIYGGHEGCAFPAIAWQPPEGDYQAGFVYPVVDFLQRNYAVAARFGDWLVLAPKEFKKRGG